MTAPVVHEPSEPRSSAPLRPEQERPALAAPARRVLGWPAMLARIGVALGAFVLVLLGMRLVAAPAGGSVIGGKLEYWRAHAQEYDTVFVGSSHVLRAFVPSEFDGMTAQRGLTTHSFNYGVQAVQLLEARYLLGQILAARPGLTRVFFEYQWLEPQIDPQNSFNPRTVYWHDADTTALAVQRALHWDAELGPGLAFVEDPSQRHALFTVADRLLSSGQRAAEEHAQHYLTNELMIGRGKDVVRGLLGRAHGQAARYGVDHGYVSLEDDARVLAAQGEPRNTYSVRRERFLANLAGYQHDVDRLAAEAQTFGDGEWVNGALTRVDDLDLMRGLVAEARAHGVEFVLVIMPSQSCNRPFEERLLDELGTLVLRYNDPEKYPALYDSAKRYDSGHLSAEGARNFSQILASEYVQQHGQPRDGIPHDELPAVRAERERQREQANEERTPQ